MKQKYIKDAKEYLRNNVDRDQEKGLYGKYHVERLNDTTHKHDNCTYFVLDLKHDKFAIPALKAYIKACRDKYPALAFDLMDLIDIYRGKP